MRTENRESIPDSSFSLKNILLSERAIIRIVYNIVYNKEWWKGVILYGSRTRTLS